LESTIKDLRTRLDSEAAERQKLTALITHQAERQARPDPANQNAPAIKLRGRGYGLSWGLPESLPQQLPCYMGTTHGTEFYAR
jgi:hypothetical protein